LAIGILSLIVQPVALAPRCQSAARSPPEPDIRRCRYSVENLFRSSWGLVPPRPPVRKAKPLERTFFATCCC